MSEPKQARLQESIGKGEAEIMTAHVFKFLRDESGATAIEYGLIAAGIALAIIAAVNGLGSSLNGKFTAISGSLGGS
jgi:pilus assembly protein Flp/PilA